MTPAMICCLKAGRTDAAADRAYRILAVLTEPRQQPHLRRYVHALAQRQEAEIGVLRNYPQADGTPPCGSAELPGPDAGKGPTEFASRPGAELAPRIGEVAARWPFDMLIAEWPDADEDVAIYARVVNAIGVTAVLVRPGDCALRRVVVPAGGGAHALEGVRVADALAKAWMLDAQVLRIVQPGPDFWLRRAELKRQCRQVRHATRLYLDVADVSLPIRVCLGLEIADEIICRCRPGDLIVIGGSSQWLMESHASTSIPSRVASGAPGPVMMVLTPRGRPSALTDVFWDCTARVGLHAPGRLQAVEMLVDSLIAARQVPALRRAEVVSAVMDRERARASYIGNDTAIPHAALQGFRGLTGMLGVFPNGVRFGEARDERARFVFLLLTPKESYEVYLPVLARIARFMNQADNRRDLARAQSPAEVVALLSNAERQWGTCRP